MESSRLRHVKGLWKPGPAAAAAADPTYHVTANTSLYMDSKLKARWGGPDRLPAWETQKASVRVNLLCSVQTLQIEQSQRGELASPNHSARRGDQPCEKRSCIF